ncbi:predicted protein [Thalassiosira pseudonana CCMP1335]|uniref:Uncharacterized protein n=1 Tax=Thalassiosira pseudonana TaxID=35128 RepID=B8LBH0_THAPS|nr:predicted protein [Thalassiosira pseudonana CCMP1335]EED87320.1 predicted protein [Thalassiosira pseudonana CCMP1335]
MSYPSPNYVAVLRHRRRCVLLTIAFLVIAVLGSRIKYLASLRTSHDTSKRRGGLLSVVSEHKNPVVIATIQGYVSEKGCSEKDILYNREEAVATITILSETNHTTTSTNNNKFPTIVQVGEPKHEDGGLLSTQHHLVNLISPPTTFLWNDATTAKDLCYQIDYRVEYTDSKSSLADFPTDTNSYLGTPSFRRVWHLNEFVSTETEEGGGGEWLVRQSPDKEWEWYQAMQPTDDKTTTATQTCKSWKEKRSYSLVVIGDSQPTYTCHHLIYGLTGSAAGPHEKVRCVQIKYPIKNQTTFDQYAFMLEKSPEDVVIFNPSGLWEAAYGTLDDFRYYFAKLLKHIPMQPVTLPGKVTDSKRKVHYFFAPTTAVHPINYPELPTDENKWAMTQTRVRAVNQIAEEVLQKEIAARSSSWVSLSTLSAPVDALSLSRDDDPLTPTDMRHFGSSTNEMMLAAMLCKIDEVMESEDSI